MAGEGRHRRACRGVVWEIARVAVAFCKAAASARLRIAPEAERPEAAAGDPTGPNLARMMTGALHLDPA